jgi:thiamine biosynthesis lipoprotein
MHDKAAIKHSCKSLIQQALLGIASLFLLQPASAADPVSFSGIAFNSTTWSVKISALPAGTSAPQIQEKLQAILDHVNDVLSTYQPDTELMRFNRAPLGQWVSVSPTLFGAASYAQQVSVLSSGAFDATVAPLVNLWGFGPAPRRHDLPTRTEIAAARQHIGWQKLLLDEKYVALQRSSDIQLDLSSLGEGTGADEMADYLESLGIHDYLSAVAGTFRVHGQRADGAAWQLAIETPDGSGLPLRRVQLHDQVISTAGVYRNYFRAGGRRYAHIIDPATGRPITYSGVSVSVIEPPGSAARLADASATAFLVLGPDRGYRLACRLHLPVYFLIATRHGLREKYTPEFANYLESP